MRQIEGWDSITESGELKRLPAGAYICKIIEAKDIQDKEYLDVYFDIVEGEFKDYFKVLQENSGKNYGRITRSYKTNALPFFKAFITAVTKSNAGFVWNWDEKTLTDKLCVVVFREEEYEADGVVKSNSKPFEIRSIEALKAGKIEIPAMKKLEKPVTETTEAPKDLSLANEDLPF